MLHHLNLPATSASLYCGRERSTATESPRSTFHVSFSQTLTAFCLPYDDKAVHRNAFNLSPPKHELGPNACTPLKSRSYGKMSSSGAHTRTFLFTVDRTSTFYTSYLMDHNLHKATSSALPCIALRMVRRRSQRITGLDPSARAHEAWKTAPGPPFLDNSIPLITASRG